MQPNFILYAPSVHTGGGLVLLRDLLAAWPDREPLRAFLDVRALGLVALPVTAEVTWIAPRLIDRFRAEFLARSAASGESSTMLCFHGLPPLFPLNGNVVVFVQNRLLIEQESLAQYPFRVRVRLLIERLWFRALQKQCSRFIVQTPSMASLLTHRLQRKVAVSVVPFAPSVHFYAAQDQDTSRKRFDFVYVASGEPHKNHRTLLEAWRLLAEVGLKPSLALTVNSESFSELSAEIERYGNEFGLDVVNLGVLSSVEVTNLYKNTVALIFPSLVESFGLPLVEAREIGLPVLASELDYVRDIICPHETFDPHSPISVCRAVRRFLGIPEKVNQVFTAKDFLAEILK